MKNFNATIKILFALVFVNVVDAKIPPLSNTAWPYNFDQEIEAFEKNVLSKKIPKPLYAYLFYWFDQNREDKIQWFKDKSDGANFLKKNWATITTPSPVLKEATQNLYTIYTSTGLGFSPENINNALSPDVLLFLRSSHNKSLYLNLLAVHESKDSDWTLLKKPDISETSTTAGLVTLFNGLEIDTSFFTPNMFEKSLFEKTSITIESFLKELIKITLEQFNAVASTIKEATPPQNNVFYADYEKFKATYNKLEVNFDTLKTNLKSTYHTIKQPIDKLLQQAKEIRDKKTQEVETTILPVHADNLYAPYAAHAKNIKTVLDKVRARVTLYNAIINTILKPCGIEKTNLALATSKVAQYEKIFLDREQSTINTISDLTLKTALINQDYAAAMKTLANVSRTDLEILIKLISINSAVLEAAQGIIETEKLLTNLSKVQHGSGENIQLISDRAWPYNFDQEIEAFKKNVISKTIPKKLYAYLFYWFDLRHSPRRLKDEKAEKLFLSEIWESGIKEAKYDAYTIYNANILDFEVIKVNPVLGNDILPFLNSAYNRNLYLNLLAVKASDAMYWPGDKKPDLTKITTSTTLVPLFDWLSIDAAFFKKETFDEDSLFKGVDPSLENFLNNVTKTTLEQFTNYLNSMDSTTPLTTLSTRYKELKHIYDKLTSNFEKLKTNPACAAAKKSIEHLLTEAAKQKKQKDKEIIKTILPKHVETALIPYKNNAINIKNDVEKNKEIAKIRAVVTNTILTPCGITKPDLADNAVSNYEKILLKQGEAERKEETKIFTNFSKALANIAAT